MDERNLGPNTRKLLIHKMSHDAIPDGGGLADGISFFTDPDKRKKIMAGALEWTRSTGSASQSVERCQRRGYCRRNPTPH
jgi:hypothetical protein